MRDLDPKWLPHGFFVKNAYAKIDAILNCVHCILTLLDIHIDFTCALLQTGFLVI
jgi:hypothetical protein